MSKQLDQQRFVPVLRFKQWLSEWDEYNFDPSVHRRKPDQHLYMFSMRAAELRKLCDVYRRKRDGANVEGIQRVRDESRTGRIQRYVRYGYPYGDLRPPQRTEEMLPLRKPGWLPTAIVVNILTSQDERRGKTVKDDHLISIRQTEQGGHELVLPPEHLLDDTELAPLEVIDGQHRLWAFDPSELDEQVPDDFELPVVAFYGLDIAWQAYLFWSINVSPKRINPSHAFDLYPLLRTQDWLERVGELTVYREARAQELTEVMYSHPLSVWNGRINMLGERGAGGVSQAAWVRSLLATFFSTGRGSGRPGLFQANLTRDEAPLEWTRGQQAAFLIQLWSDLKDEILNGHRYHWIRLYETKTGGAFFDKTSMLNQDMGVRALLAVANDIFFENAELWHLDRWRPPLQGETDSDQVEIDDALADLQNASFRPRLKELAAGLARFDWRSLDGPGVQNEQEIAILKRSYRGSGGYASLREDVLKSVIEQDNEVSRAARQLLASEV